MADIAYTKEDQRKLDLGALKWDLSAIDKVGRPQLLLRSGDSYSPVQSAQLPELEHAVTKVTSPGDIRDGDIIVVKHKGGAYQYAERVTKAEGGEIRAIGMRKDRVQEKDRSNLFAGAQLNKETGSWTRPNWSSEHPGEVEIFVLRLKSGAKPAEAPESKPAAAGVPKQPSQSSPQQPAAQPESFGAKFKRFFKWMAEGK